MNKNEELLPYYEKARDTLDYNSETGIFTWKVNIGRRAKIGCVAGSLDNKGYRQIKITINGKSKTLKTHRLAWLIQYGELPDTIDHINGIKDDNSISNLRSCTSQQNLFNRGNQINNKSGFKGVNWRKDRKKWQARIKYNETYIHLGYFHCPKEASEAYQAKAKELHGEFYYEKS